MTRRITQMMSYFVTTVEATFDPEQNVPLLLLMTISHSTAYHGRNSASHLEDVDENFPASIANGLV